ncbi:MAG: ribosomal protein S33 [Marteilia pararefringens]
MLVKPLPRPAGEGGKALTMYQRRMRWLSQQIFGTLHKQQFQIAPDTGGNSNARFSKDWRVARYFSEKPVHSRHDLIDLYYPPYAEIDGLMTKLRQYGLFRY